MIGFGRCSWEALDSTRWSIYGSRGGPELEQFQLAVAVTRGQEQPSLCEKWMLEGMLHMQMAVHPSFESEACVQFAPYDYSSSTSSLRTPSLSFHYSTRDSHGDSSTFQESTAGTTYPWRHRTKDYQTRKESRYCNCTRS